MARPDTSKLSSARIAQSGLQAIVAIYSTALGPALGGTRFYPYASEDEALADVLNLSRAMAYKNALAGLDLGGGKAVIIGDPAELKSEALLRAYGRFVQSLNGRYITACDIGTYSEDMDIVARECSFVTGRTVPNGGAGDSSVLTAFGVFQGMRAAAEHAWGSTSLDGRTVGVEGVGKVGHRLADHLISDGARVVIYDTSHAATERVRAQHPEVTVAASRAELLRGSARRVLAVRARRCRRRRHGGRTPGCRHQDHLRWREQPAGPPWHREDAGRPRNRVRARLPGELGRRHPGG